MMQNITVNFGQLLTCRDICGIFQKQQFKNYFAKENLKLVEVLPMKFDSFYVSLLSEKYKNGKMNFLKAFGLD